jgi:hypothetical protein
MRRVTKENNGLKRCRKEFAVSGCQDHPFRAAQVNIQESQPLKRPRRVSVSTSNSYPEAYTVPSPNQSFFPKLRDKPKTCTIDPSISAPHLHREVGPDIRPPLEAELLYPPAGGLEPVLRVLACHTDSHDVPTWLHPLRRLEVERLRQARRCLPRVMVAARWPAEKAAHL